MATHLAAVVLKVSRRPRRSNRRSSLAAAAAAELGQEASERSPDPEPSELDPDPDPARRLRLDTLVARLSGGSRRSLFSLLGHGQPDPARTRLADLVRDDETRSLGLPGWGDETRSLDPGYDEASIIGRDRDDETRIVGGGWAGHTGGLGGVRDNEKKARAFFEIWDDETRILISEDDDDDDDDTTRTDGPLDGETWASGRDIDGSRSYGEAWEWEDETRTQGPGPGSGDDETRTQGPGPGVDEIRIPAVWGYEACTLVACEPWNDGTRTIVVPGSWGPSPPPRRGCRLRRARRGPGWVVGLESILPEPAGDLPLTEDEMCRVLMRPPDDKLLFDDDGDGDDDCGDSDKNDGVSSEGDEEVAGFEIVAMADKEDGQMIHVSHKPTRQEEKCGADDKGWVDLSPAASAVPQLEEETWIVALEARVRATPGPHPTAHLQAAACDPVPSSSACSTKAVAVGSVTETEA